MRLDPISLEILNNKATAAAEEMCFTLQRTGRSLYVKETEDFACALATVDGEFFAYPRSVGVSGFVALDCLPSIQAVNRLEPGDVILTNDPYRSQGLATHLPDLHLIEPYFHEGRIVAYGWCFVHCSDIGGRVPSSISPVNDSIFQEGLQIPPVRLVRKGIINEDVEAIFCANTRTPDANLGDVRAMLAALAAGRRRVAQLIAQHGVETFLDAQSDLIEYSAAKALIALKSLSNGTYRFSDYLDDDAVSTLPVRFCVALTVSDGQLHLDLTGTDPQLAAAMNIPSHGRPHAWLTLRVLALIFTLDPTVPVNIGLLRHVRITAPKGTVVNPEHPAAVGVRHAAAVRVNDLLNGALGLCLPDIMPAASSGMVVPLVVAEPDGHGGQKVQVVEPMIGGTGGRLGHDGIDGRDSGLSNLSNNPVETVEAEIGVEVLEYGLRVGSGGPGQWRGGCGMRIKFKILHNGSFVLARGLERFKFRPWGTRGGRPGMLAQFIVNPGTEKEQRYSKLDACPVESGDIVELLAPGAGGYGDPYKRDPSAVLADVQKGLVSLESAEGDYGVFIHEGQVDIERTRLHRARNPNIDTQHSFGTERERWESVFVPEAVDALTKRLLTLPRDQRTRKRELIYSSALALLPEHFPAEQGGDERQLREGRSAFNAAIADLEG